MANETRQVSIFINGKEVENSIKAIATQKRVLQNEVAKLVRGTDEYNAKVKELANVNGILQEHQNKIKGIEAAWYKNIPVVQNYIAVGAGLFAADKIIQYGTELGALSVKMDGLSRKSITVLAGELDKATAAGEKNAAAMGLTTSQYVAQTAGIADLLIPMGFQRDQAADISLQLTNLSGALAEWSSGTKSSEDAQHALSAALLGEREELKSYGIALSEEDVKQRLVKKGMDDLTGARLQQAKAIATMELILEKSVDAQTSYATNTDSLIRQQSEMKAKFAEVAENLSKIFVPILAMLTGALAAVIQPVADLTEWLTKLSNPAEASLEAFKGQSAEVKNLEKNINPLLARYDELTSKTNLTTKEQTELKNIAQKVGEVIPIAASSFDQYGKAMSLNTIIAREFIETEKVRLQYLNEGALIEQRNAVFRMELQRDQLAKQLETKTTSRIVDLNTMETVEQDISNENLQKVSASLNTIQKRIDGANAQIKYLSGETLKLPSTTATTPSVIEPESDKAKKAREKIENELEKLREAITKHRSDLRQQESSDDERDAERIKEKYRKDIEAAKELETRKVKGAADLRLQLESLRDAEIEAKQEENTTKRLEKLNEITTKYEAEFRTAKLQGIDKELSDINTKYDAEIQKLNALKGTDGKTTEAAQNAEAQIEAARRAEVQAVRDKYDLEYTEKVKAFLNDVAQLQADDEARENAQLEVKYTELLLKADKLGIADFEITKWYEEQKAKIKKEYLDKNSKQAEESAKKDLEKQKRIAESEVKIQEAKIAAFNDLATFLGEVIGESGKKSLGFFLLQKAIAASEVILNMFKEQAAHAAYAATMGPPGIAYLATMSTLSKIRTAFALGTIAAQTIAQVQQKEEGGYHDVIGAQDGRAYRAKSAPDFGGGFVNEPTLVGEQIEYTIPNRLLRNPLVANFVPIIEAIRTNRGVSPQRAQGGYNNEAPTTAPTIAQPSMGSDRAITVLENIYEALISGKIMAIVTTEGSLEIDKLIKKGKEIRGY